MALLFFASLGVTVGFVLFIHDNYSFGSQELWDPQDLLSNNCKYPFFFKKKLLIVLSIHVCLTFVLWFGEITIMQAGLIFGCSWKQWDGERYKLFTLESQDTLSVFTYFGYMLYLFVLALKMDVRMLSRTKRKAYLVALPAFVGPMICGHLVTTLLLPYLDRPSQKKVSLMVSLHCMVSLPVIENVLRELNMISSDIGRLGLSAALVGDMLSQLGLVAGNAVRLYQVSAVRGFFYVAGFFFEGFLIWFVFKPATLWMIKRTPKGKLVGGSNIQGVMCLVLLSSAVSVLLSQPAILGPYLLGLIIPDGSPLVISMIERLDFFVSELFLPIFIAMSALQADLSILLVGFKTVFTQFNIVLAFVTFSVKVISSFLGSLYSGLPVHDSLALAFLMSNKGIVELAFITILRGYSVCFLSKTPFLENSITKLSLDLFLSFFRSSLMGFSYG